MRTYKRTATVADYLRYPYVRHFESFDELQEYEARLQQNLKRLKGLVDQQMGAGESVTVEL